MKNAFTEDLFGQLATVTREELDKVANQLEPAKEGSGEVGVLSDDLQKLYAVTLRTKKQADETIAKLIPVGLAALIRRNGSTEDALKTFDESIGIISRAEAEREFFWASVRAELKIFGKSDMSLVEGWKIVDNTPICKGCGERHIQPEIPNFPSGLENLFSDDLPFMVVSMEEIEVDRPRMFGRSFQQLRRDLRTVFERE